MDSSKREGLPNHEGLTLGATLTVTRTLSPHYRAVPRSCKEEVAALLLLVAVFIHDLHVSCVPLVENVNHPYSTHCFVRICAYVSV